MEEDPGQPSAALPPSGVAVGAAHGEVLPKTYASRIPAQDERILRFLLEFLQEQGLQDVPVFVNGGYVRDLLLGKTPDDLDLSICLCGCADDVTVSGLLEQIPAFAAAVPALGITSVKIATILSDESKNKMLDTAKAHFTDVDDNKTEVDVMPTIGEERYEEGSRVPVRDQRGTPEQDALRRDLTIGALLLRVRRGALPSDGLRFELLDYFGGVEDLQKGVLRAPFPGGRSLEEVCEAVLRTPEEQELALQLGIRKLSPSDAVQAVWWAKILLEDPLRICRALRFAAKLRGFALHDSFWLAVPFALQALRAKVAGSRKNTEYLKIGGYGIGPCRDFFELAFARAFPGPDRELRLAAALFGGADEKGLPHSISEMLSFDDRALGMFRACLAPLQGVRLEPAEVLGLLLASALYCADGTGGTGPGIEFSRACDGMCVSNALREAGASTLMSVARMASEPPMATSLDLAFAAACGGMAVESFCLHQHVWDAARTAFGPSGKMAEAHGHRQAVVLEMLRHRHPQRALEAEACMQALSRSRPPVRGSVLSIKGVLEVPPQLRGPFMRALDVGLRLLSYDAPVEGEETLGALLEAHPALRQAVSPSVWMQEDGKTLKPEFQPAKKGKYAKAR